MGDLVNLNRARKERDKAQSRATAAANRVLHGLTRTERQAAKAERERADRLIEGHASDGQDRRED